MNNQALTHLYYLYGLQGHHGKTLSHKSRLSRQKQPFTKRTHFQSSRSIPASDKSPCRLSVFQIILGCLGSCVLRFLYFSKRTHFRSSRLCRVTPTPNTDLRTPNFFTKRTQIDNRISRANSMNLIEYRICRVAIFYIKRLNYFLT
jgi:hypothetical protein